MSEVDSTSFTDLSQSGGVNKGDKGDDEDLKKDDRTESLLQDTTDRVPSSGLTSAVNQGRSTSRNTMLCCTSKSVAPEVDIFSPSLTQSMHQSLTQSECTTLNLYDNASKGDEGDDEDSKEDDETESLHQDTTDRVPSSGLTSAVNQGRSTTRNTMLCCTSESVVHHVDNLSPSLSQSMHQSLTQSERNCPKDAAHDDSFGNKSDILVSSISSRRECGNYTKNKHKGHYSGSSNSHSFGLGVALASNITTYEDDKHENVITHYPSSAGVTRSKNTE